MAASVSGEASESDGEEITTDDLPPLKGRGIFCNYCSKFNVICLHAIIIYSSYWFIQCMPV
jgi:hypothetical protein